MRLQYGNMATVPAWRCREPKNECRAMAMAMATVTALLPRLSDGPSFHRPGLIYNGFLLSTDRNIAPKSRNRASTSRLRILRTDQWGCRPPSTVSAIASSAVSEAFHVTESGKFSISDAQLNSRGFVLHKSVDKLDLDQLNAVFVKVGFPRRQKEKLERALNNTPSLVWVEERKSGKLVAFARATGDDVFNAIIWDVVVDPSFQGFGLGKAVMERVMADLLAKGITNIALYAEPHVLGFYRSLGFIADPDGIKAMVYSKKPQKPR